MQQGKKIRVAVLYGGRSGEHEISLLSAANVIQNLDKTKFEVVPIGIDKQGVWYLGDENLKKELMDSQPLRLPNEQNNMLFNPEYLGKNLEVPSRLSNKRETSRLFDVVFPAIHGSFCEDGTIQGLLEIADLPYVGCGVLSSAINMDKDVSKRLIRDAGIAIAPYLVVRSGQWQHSAKEFCQLVEDKLSFPVFVKPANTGSSVGINKVKSREDLENAINVAFQYDTKILVEKAINGQELEVAVLESLNPGHDPLVSVVGEIKPQHEFYSYAAKYLDEHGALLKVPADIDDALQLQVRDVAKRIFSILECEGMARVDLFLEHKTHKIYFNEVNTIPGFTQISMYPKMMAASGMKYSELLTQLIMLAVERHKNKSRLSREYVVA